jgi:hypothetical protein
MHDPEQRSFYEDKEQILAGRKNVEPVKLLNGKASLSFRAGFICC